MRKLLIKLLGVKQRTHYYGMFLKKHPDVHPKAKPKLVHPLSHDMDLELYLGDTSKAREEYATVVVAVKKGNRTYRTKYDSGRVFKEPEKMLSDCISGIRVGWDTTEFRKWAYEAFERDTSFMDKWLYGI